MSKTSLKKELRDLQKAAKQAERQFARELGQISRNETNAIRICNASCREAKRALAAIQRRLKTDRKIAKRAHDKAVENICTRRSIVQGRLVS